MQKLAELDTKQIVKDFETAHTRYRDMLEASGDLAQLKEVPKQPTADVSWASADVSLKFFILKGHVTADLTFDVGGKKVHFDAWPWGVGQGFLGGVGKYYGVPANTLLMGGGACSYHCQWGAVGPGILQITLWRENFGALGQVNAAVGGEGVGETGGKDGKLTAG